MTSTAPHALVLWDVDHTLIENGGVSKANYALAFRLITGRTAAVEPSTDGRTDLDIMGNLFVANDVDPPTDAAAIWVALTKAGRLNETDLRARGHALAGAAECLARLAGAPGIINSVLTGNIEPNARVKLEAFNLDKWIDFTVGGYGSEHRVRSQLVPLAQAKAADRYAFDPARDVTVLIGDTHRDVEAGIHGGARVIAVATGVDSEDALRGSGADVVLPSLADVDAFMCAFEQVRGMGPTTPR